MPNHIKNLIMIDPDETSAERIAEVFEAIKNGDVGVGSIDFNKVIPMPEHVYRGNLGPEERQKYGKDNWYDWAADSSHWNTKWNAYDFETFEDGDTSISFSTAWSSPHPILQKLSEMFPDVHFQHLWADEDIGYNCGEREYHGGTIKSENIPTGGSKEAYDLAAEIRDYDLLELGLRLSADESGYVYCENDEYELIDLFEKPALFTIDRTGAGDIPKGLYCYDFRECETGRFCSIEPHVTANHGGTVITDYPLDFGTEGYIALDDDSAPHFLGEHITLEQYIQGDYEATESQIEGLQM